MTSKAAAGGFGMIEVLVSIVIFTVGLLGLVATHTRMHLTELEAYYSSLVAPVNQTTGYQESLGLKKAVLPVLVARTIALLFSIARYREKSKC